jgi:predicted transcriptional regulator
MTGIIVLFFLYLKISSKKKNNHLVEKIEYLCKNLKVLLQESENSTDKIQGRIEDFKSLYDKNLLEIEHRIADLNDIAGKLEKSEGVKDMLEEKDHYKKIKNLLNEGHTVENISEMLKISKGEVELISKLKNQAG